MGFVVLVSILLVVLVLISTGSVKYAAQSALAR